jgi:tetratricopeptide (TPR) repeat protein
MKITPLFIAFFLAAPSLQAGTADGNNSPPLERAQALLESSKYQEALAALSSFQPLEADLTTYHGLLARTFEGAGNLTGSIEHYRIAYLFARTPEEKERYLLRRAGVYSALGYDAEAALTFDVFLKHFPASPSTEVVHLDLAECRVRLGQYREALTHYGRAGTSSRALFGKASVMHHLGMIEDAHALFLSLIEKDRDYLNTSAAARYAVGENFRLLGLTADAILYLNTVQEPVLQERAALGLGFIDVQEGRYDSALKYFARAQESSEASVRRQALLASAESLRKAGRPKEAAEMLLEIKRSHPYSKEYDHALLQLAKIYRGEGKRSDAASLLRELVFRRSPDGRALDELDTIMREALTQDRNEFVRLWNESGQWLLDPSRTASLLIFAGGLKHTGRPFLDLCRWLLKYGENDAKVQVRLLLAGFYADLGDGATAQNYLARVQARSGVITRDAYLATAARVHLANGDRVKAAEAVIAMDQPSQQDISLLLDAARSMQDVGTSLNAIERSLRKAPVAPHSSVLFADLLFSAGRKAEARRYYEAATAADPGSAGSDKKDIEWARYRLGRMAADGSPRADAGVPRSGNSSADRLREANLRGAAVTERAKKVL